MLRIAQACSASDITVARDLLLEYQALLRVEPFHKGVEPIESPRTIQGALGNAGEASMRRVEASRRYDDRQLQPRSAGPARGSAQKIPVDGRRLTFSVGVAEHIAHCVIGPG